MGKPTKIRSKLQWTWIILKAKPNPKDFTQKNSPHSKVYNFVFVLTKIEIQEHKHKWPMAGNSKPQCSDSDIQYSHCLRKKGSLTWSRHSGNLFSFLLFLFFLFSLSCTCMHMLREWIRYPSLGHHLMWLSQSETPQSPLSFSFAFSLYSPFPVLQFLLPPTLTAAPLLTCGWLFTLIKVTDKTSRGGSERGRN